MKVFCVLDIKAKFYMRPFFESSTVNALRGWETAVNDSDTAFRKFPNDFCLMELGSFDPETGRFSLLDHPIDLGTALTVLRTAPMQGGLPGVGSPNVEVVQQ